MSIFSRIRDLFRPAPPPEPIVDEVLGTVQFNAEEDDWEVQVGGSPGWKIRFGGRAAPDAARIAHAREVATNAENFLAMVASYLREEVRNYDQYYENEILSLRLEYLSLLSPKRPRGGMLFFEGGENFRLWRCDYVDGKPRDLGFDS